MRQPENFGRAPLSGKPKIPINGAKDYVQKLRSGFVLVRAEERRKKIETELRHLAAGKGLRLHEDAHLMDLVTYLNEFPTAILGEFDPAFLDLPDEILITVMRGHQNTSRWSGRAGLWLRISSRLLTWTKIGPGAIRAGHERVLRARFAMPFFLGDGSEMSARRLFAEIGSGSPSRRSSAAMAIRSSACAPWRVGLRAVVCEQHPAGQRRLGGPCAELASATWSPTWSVSSPSCRGSSEACTQKLKENLKMWLGPYTITTSPRRSMIPFEKLYGPSRRARGQARLFGGLLRGGVGPVRVERPIRAAPRGHGNRKNPDRTKLPLSLSLAVARAVRTLAARRRR